MQKRHRIFIAINLPSDVKKVLSRYQQRWPELPAKWVSRDNLHITLVFLGDLTDQELGEVCMSVKEVAAGYQTFNITLNRVCYGPDEKIPPKMLWASGEKSPELSRLKHDLQDALLEKVDFTPELRAFSPHVTLARISAFAWRQIEPEERPEVGEDIELSFTAESIDVMQSERGKNGPHYTVVESAPLL
jgi:2'-5' RNA ligase